MYKYLAKFKLILIIIIITAIFGEIKIQIFNSSFRFALGSAAFFFFLLLFRTQVNYMLIGTITGIFTVFFRVSLDYIIHHSNYNLYHSFFNYFPIIGYYLIYALIISLNKKIKSTDDNFFIGSLGTIADVSGNLTEVLIRFFLFEKFLFSLELFKYILLVAIFRSFFIAGLYSMWQNQKIRVVLQEKKKRLEQIQLITSELYIETFYLQKGMKMIEHITANSFKLYRELNKISVNANLIKDVLNITQEIHELKKDYQRILAGLQKIIDKEKSFSKIYISELLDLAVRSNKKYAQYLKKEIHFEINIKDDLIIENIFPLLVIINNILANAVEAIEKKGTVAVDVFCNNEVLELIFKDSALSLKKEDFEIIFIPGYTTKFSEHGEPSTGIGLSHVKTVIDNLNGNIKIEIDSQYTKFIVSIPKKNLI